MTMRRAPFTVGEWYHCYNTSLDRRVAFADVRDYQRFLEIIYLANDQFPLRRDDIGKHRFEEILGIPRGKRLVAVGAFSLMPSHFHLVLREITKGGITSFMRKVGTAYTLYFNSRNKRAGNLFLKPFQSRQTLSEQHLQQLVSYVHCNPALLYEPEWRARHVVDPPFLSERLASYPYSSMSAHSGASTPVSAIIDSEILATARTISIQKLLQEARQYSANIDIP